MANEPERAVRTPTPAVGGETRIVPRKTALGSYIIIRRIAAGGMGEVWEGWLIPSSELGWQLLRGERRDLRKIAGVGSTDDELTREEKDQVMDWMRARTEEFLKNPPDTDTYRQMLDWVSPHRRLGQDYRRAIKILNPELAKSPELVRRFEREIAFLSRLNHPNIVKVVESGVAGPHHFAAMEYVDAQPMEELKLSIPEMVHVIRQTLDGLIHAHAQGVLHRDLKPGNILVRQDLGAVKLTDFGIAKALDEAGDGQLTKTGVIVGTPYYLDPERARGEPSVEQSDVYSLGATLYRMLTGEPPAKAARPMDAVALIQSPKDPRWPRESNPRVSEELEDAVMMMLSKDLKARLGSQEARVLLKFLDENNALLHSEPTGRQRRSNAKQARRLFKEVRRQRAHLEALGDAMKVADVRKLYTLYEDCAEFNPRDEEAGVSERLQLYEEALWFHREVAAKRGEAFLKGVKDRAALIEKRRFLELRRMERRGFRRRVRRRIQWGRSVVFAAAGLLIVGLAVLSGLRIGEDLQSRRRLERSLEMAETALLADQLTVARAQVVQAAQDAQELPLSSPPVRRLRELEDRVKAAERLDQAASRAGRLQRLVQDRDFPAAAAERDAARRLLDEPLPEGDVVLAGRRRELLAKLEQDERVVDRSLADVRLHAGLVRALADLEAQTARLPVPAPKADLDALLSKLDAVSFKLHTPDLLDPDLVGPALAESRKRAAALRSKLKP